MPLYSYVCDDGHESSWFGAHSVRPPVIACEHCQETAAYSLGTTARPFPKTPAAEQQPVRVRGEAPRFGLLKWWCEPCNVTFQEVLAREEEDTARLQGRPCPRCHGAAKWIPSWNVDRFAERIDTSGGYYDRGLGTRITSPAHRREVCKERGLTPVDGDWDVDREFRKQDDARERDEREYAVYNDEAENHPKFAGYRRARDLGIL